MIRGTTPTLTFSVPFNTSMLTILSVAFSQNGELALEKTLADVECDGQLIRVPLTEEDTLSFSHDATLKIQLRCGIGNIRFASKITHTIVGEILKDGAL